jgi:hypothetical protein
MPTAALEVGGSLVAEENQLPFQMSLGRPYGAWLVDSCDGTLKTGIFITLNSRIWHSTG